MIAVKNNHDYVKQLFLIPLSFDTKITKHEGIIIFFFSSSKILNLVVWINDIGIGDDSR